jgi:hypothetical protein
VGIEADSRLRGKLWPSALKTLVCDHGSLEQCVIPWLENGPSTASLDSLSRLGRIDIELKVLDLETESYIALLKQAKFLGELELTGMWRDFGIHPLLD